jgi:hypothetical protein
MRSRWPLAEKSTVAAVRARKTSPAVRIGAHVPGAIPPVPYFRALTRRLRRTAHNRRLRSPAVWFFFMTDLRKFGFMPPV